MSNPIYEELKRADKAKDITAIDNIVEVYIQSNGKYLDLDKARKKIQELQKKDEIIFAMTAPKPSMPSTPWECTTETQLCHALINIRDYLIADLANDVRKSEEEKDNA